MQRGSRTAIWMWDSRKIFAPGNAGSPSWNAPRTRPLADRWCTTDEIGGELSRASMVSEHPSGKTLHVTSIPRQRRLLRETVSSSMHRSLRSADASISPAGWSRPRRPRTHRTGTTSVAEILDTDERHRLLRPTIQVTPPTSAHPRTPLPPLTAQPGSRAPMSTTTETKPWRAITPGSPRSPSAA